MEKKKELLKLEADLCRLRSTVKLYFHEKIEREEFIRLFFEDMAEILRRIGEFLPI